MIKKGKILALMLTVIMLFQIGYSNVLSVEDSESLSYLYSRTNYSDTNRVFYTVYYRDVLNSVFQMKAIFNNKTLDKVCEKQISFNEESTSLEFEKITCEIPKLGNGEYVFEAFLFDENGNILEKIVNREYVLEDNKASIRFKELGNDSTEIIIEIKKENREENCDNVNFLVTSYIPKGVIEELNDENKNDLIKSDLEYEILDSDPLIAWNIDEVPKTINYTINKKISIEEQNKFRVEIVENKNFQFFKYLVFALILVIIGFVFKPMFNNKNKIKNKNQDKNE